MSNDINNINDNDHNNDEINFLDSLDTEPTAKARSRTPPQVSQVSLPPASPVFHKVLEFAGIALISAALTAGLVVWKLGPREVAPAPSVNALKLGRTFVPKLAHALADGFEAGADAIKAGKSLGEGDALIKTTFHASRAKAFDDHASQAIHELVPDGQEIKDVTTRNAVVDLFRGFAQGLREAQ
ncbi:hypothetical protein V5E97_10315 [Singulisphaera sp. Ch08]|uniref:Uncharacterized protein n=1 Tax=Singulisphaera sp. Ch08 TaxID=3120278 RepID=A0AAU7CMW5_9BACT